MATQAATASKVLSRIGGGSCDGSCLARGRCRVDAGTKAAIVIPHGAWGILRSRNLERGCSGSYPVEFGVPVGAGGGGVRAEMYSPAVGEHLERLDGDVVRVPYLRRLQRNESCLAGIDCVWTYELPSVLTISDATNPPRETTMRQPYTQLSSETKHRGSIYALGHPTMGENSAQLFEWRVLKYGMNCR